MWEKALEITGRTEINHRDDMDEVAKEYKNAVGQKSYSYRFDYVDGSGNYIETREARYNNGNQINPSTLNKNDPAEKQKEKRFKLSELQKN